MEAIQPVEADGLSVEELSARTGAPVRTIREYQTWRVLHPPTRAGRRAFYDDSHVRRLEAIARLQERGYSIAAIRELFDAWAQGERLSDVLGIDDAVGVPADEAPVRLSRAQLDEVLPSVTSSDRLLRRACAVRVLARDGDAFVARSPALVSLVADTIAAGASATAALDLADAITSAADEAGEAVASLVAQGPDGDVDALLRRGRVLLARAIATHTIDGVGRHLLDRAGDDPHLAELVAAVRIGTAPRPSKG
jgi:DNA-binding transcriptional MerR regulator